MQNTNSMLLEEENTLREARKKLILHRYIGEQSTSSFSLGDFYLKKSTIGYIPSLRIPISGSANFE